MHINISVPGYKIRCFLCQVNRTYQLACNSAKLRTSTLLSIVYREVVIFSIERESVVIHMFTETTHVIP